METTDLTKTYKPYYSAKVRPEFRLTEAGEFLSMIGRGDPSGQDYAERMHALYATAFALRKIARAEGSDFMIPKLEVLWDFSATARPAVSLAEVPLRIPRKDWGYCLMLRMPCYVTRTWVGRAMSQITGATDRTLAGEIELHARLPERVVQVLHRGPLEEEPLSLKRIETFMRERYLLQDGLYHEIYLTDFRHTEAANRRTIIRIPVKEKASAHIPLY